MNTAEQVIPAAPEGSGVDLDLLLREISAIQFPNNGSFKSYDRKYLDLSELTAKLPAAVLRDRMKTIRSIKTPAPVGEVTASDLASNSIPLGGPNEPWAREASQRRHFGTPKFATAQRTMPFSRTLNNDPPVKYELEEGEIEEILRFSSIPQAEAHQLIRVINVQPASESGIAFQTMTRPEIGAATSSSTLSASDGMVYHPLPHENFGQRTISWPKDHSQPTQGQQLYRYPAANNDRGTMVTPLVGREYQVMQNHLASNPSQTHIRYTDRPNLGHISYDEAIRTHQPYASTFARSSRPTRYFREHPDNQRHKYCPPFTVARKGKRAKKPKQSTHYNSQAGNRNSGTMSRGDRSRSPRPANERADYRVRSDQHRTKGNLTCVPCLINRPYRLCDGQHRCTNCVISNSACYYSVCMLGKHCHNRECAKIHPLQVTGKAQQWNLAGKARVKNDNPSVPIKRGVGTFWQNSCVGSY